MNKRNAAARKPTFYQAAIFGFPNSSECNIERFEYVRSSQKFHFRKAYDVASIRQRP
jgi:hypothetical protein